tara:strand:- start:75071 stop:76165 length:1095 start_codon:yes stop_codon:yes gene_type:complete
MKFNKFLGLLALGVIGFTSCEDADDNMNVIDPEEEQEETIESPYDEGFLVANEGPFNNGFGTISYVSVDLSVVTNDVYQTENAPDNLGNVVNSIGFDVDLAYVVANVSNRITVLNRKTLIEEGRVETGLVNPRFFVAVNGKGYVSNWGDPFDETDDYVAVINLRTLNVDNVIPVALGPEKIVFNGTNVYVAHKGAFGTNNIVSVINPIDDTVTTTIEVGDVPSGLEFDSQGNLWVLSQGNPSFTMNETAGKISRVDVLTNTVNYSADFATTEHPDFLNIEEDNLYFFLEGGVFVGDALDYLVPTTAQLTVPFYYNMNIINGKLYGCNAGDFASNGTVEVYDLSTNSLEASLDVGIIPGDVYLNE